jgi:flagellar motor switch protein FliN/FliY
MTIHVPDVAVPAALADLAAAVAVAALPLIPSGETLEIGTVAGPGTVDAGLWTAGARARLVGADTSVGVLVGQELSDALATAPGGALDLGAALQPALDAMATALGAAAGRGEALSGDGVGTAVAAASFAVPLTAGDAVAALVFASTTPAPVTADADTGQAPRPAVAPRGVELLHGVAMEVTVELGRTRLSVRELLALAPGDVLELDRAAGSPADLLVNGRLIARGEVVVVDEDFALRVTEIVAHGNAV